MNRQTAFGYINYYYNMMKNSNKCLSENTKNVIYENYLKYGTRPDRSPSRDNFIYEIMASRCGARSVIGGEAYTELLEKIGAMYP